MNSARSFGPALLSSTWEFHYVSICYFNLFLIVRMMMMMMINYDLKVYWIGPILGGILAGITHKFLFKIDSN